MTQENSICTQEKRGCFKARFSNVHWLSQEVVHFGKPYRSIMFWISINEPKKNEKSDLSILIDENIDSVDDNFAKAKLIEAIKNKVDFLTSILGVL